MVSIQVAIDARMVGRSGIGRYVTELIRALEKSGEVHPIVLGYHRQGSQRLSSGVFSLMEQLEVPLAARRVKAELLHVPHFNAPGFLRHLMVVTIHDVAYLDHPEWLPSSFKRLAYRSLMSMVVRRASAILTVSEFSKRRICHHFGLDPSLVYVTYPAPFRIEAPATKVSDLPNPLGREIPFFLYVGNLRPHKNVGVLVRAFRRVCRRFHAPLQLVLVGEKQTGYAELDGLCTDDVVWLGVQPDDVVTSLYQSAMAFVLPSKYEGFGLPALEAMAAGCPTIVSRAASLPEVVGTAALTFDPDDEETLANHMERVTADRLLRERLMEQGRNWASQFRWERTAQQTLEVYKHVVGKAGR